jgi:hypothetical protein
MTFRDEATAWIDYHAATVRKIISVDSLSSLADFT